jgi:hypothetical protein
LDNTESWSIPSNIITEAANTNSDPSTFGQDIAWHIASAFFHDVGQIEEWGCSTGSRIDLYLVDSARTNRLAIGHVKQVPSDRRTKRSAIYIRHVLEHRRDWEEVLAYAAASAEQKLCLCLSTPFAEATVKIAGSDIAGASLLSLPKKLIEKHLAGFHWKLMEGIQGGGGACRQESIYLAWKSTDAARDRMELELRQRKLANLVLARERDLLLAANLSKNARDPQSSFGEEVLIKFYRKYLRKQVGRCRKLILGR